MQGHSVAILESDGFCEIQLASSLRHLAVSLFLVCSFHSAHSRYKMYAVKSCALVLRMGWGIGTYGFTLYVHAVLC